MSDSTEVQRYADPAMYASEAMPEGMKGPRVHLLEMTADPLGAIASASMMYEGKVVRGLSEVTDRQRMDYFTKIQATHLKAPFEFVNFHFMIEGVTRSFTHQMVRQRTAVYAQESLRFAVKDKLDEEVPLPPSLAGLADDSPRVRLWRKAVNTTEDVYAALIADGVPAEDARGLLPHSTPTRLHYGTNLRGLHEHAGNRLCTQAQFEWRTVLTAIVAAIRNYGNDQGENAWQFHTLADIFRPICYLTGKCEFMAEGMDRYCTIRERVEQNHRVGRESKQWDVSSAPNAAAGQRYDGAGKEIILPIYPVEWLLDSTAARER